MMTRASSVGVVCLSLLGFAGTARAGGDYGSNCGSSNNNYSVLEKAILECAQVVGDSVACRDVYTTIDEEVFAIDKNGDLKQSVSVSKLSQVLAAIISSVNSRIGDIRSDVADLELVNADQDEQIADVQGQIDTLDADLVAVEEKLSTFEACCKKLEELQGQMKELGEKFGKFSDEIGSQIDGVSGRVAQVEGTVKEVKELADILKGEYGVVGAKVEALTGDIAAINEKVEFLGRQLGELDKRSQEADTALLAEIGSLEAADAELLEMHKSLGGTVSQMADSIQYAAEQHERLQRDVKVNFAAIEDKIAALEKAQDGLGASYVQEKYARQCLVGYIAEEKADDPADSLELRESYQDGSADLYADSGDLQDGSQERVPGRAMQRTICTSREAAEAIGAGYYVDLTGLEEADAEDIFVGAARRKWYILNVADGTETGEVLVVNPEGVDFESPEVVGVSASQLFAALPESIGQLASNASDGVQIAALRSKVGAIYGQLKGIAGQIADFETSLSTFEEMWSIQVKELQETDRKLQEQADYLGKASKALEEDFWKFKKATDGNIGDLWAANDKLDSRIAEVETGLLGFKEAIGSLQEKLGYVGERLAKAEDRIAKLEEGGGSSGGGGASGSWRAVQTRQWTFDEAGEPRGLEEVRIAFLQSQKEWSAEEYAGYTYVAFLEDGKMPDDGVFRGEYAWSLPLYQAKDLGKADRKVTVNGDEQELSAITVQPENLFAALYGYHLDASRLAPGRNAEPVNTVAGWGYSVEQDGGTYRQRAERIIIVSKSDHLKGIEGNWDYALILDKLVESPDDEVFAGRRELVLPLYDLKGEATDVVLGVNTYKNDTRLVSIDGLGLYQGLYGHALAPAAPPASGGLNEEQVVGIVQKETSESLNTLWKYVKGLNSDYGLFREETILTLTEHESRIVKVEERINGIFQGELFTAWTRRVEALEDDVWSIKGTLSGYETIFGDFQAETDERFDTIGARYAEHLGREVMFAVEHDANGIATLYDGFALYDATVNPKAEFTVAFPKVDLVAFANGTQILGETCVPVQRFKVDYVAADSEGNDVPVRACIYGRGYDADFISSETNGEIILTVKDLVFMQTGRETRITEFMPARSESEASEFADRLDAREDGVKEIQPDTYGDEPDPTAQN